MFSDPDFRPRSQSRRPQGRPLKDTYGYRPPADRPQLRDRLLQKNKAPISDVGRVPRPVAPSAQPSTPQFQSSYRPPAREQAPAPVVAAPQPMPVHRSDYVKAAKRPAKSRRVRRWPVIIMLIILLGGLGTHVVMARAAEGAAAKQATADAAARTLRIAGLPDQIKSVFDQYPGITFSVSLVDLSNGNRTHIGSSQDFTAASTGKMITATDYLYQVQHGTKTLTQTIDGESAESLLEKMIVNSDNQAWADLNDTLTHTNLKTYSESQIGISDYDPDANTLSSDDMSLLLEKLWQGKLLNNANKQLLLGYMKRANYRQFAVPAVPSEDTIYHKIGVLQDLVHDATIITHGNQAFVMAIYTDGNGDFSWDTRATAIQAITKYAIKAYLNN